MRESPLILLADDEPNIRQTLIEILEGEGFEAISVSDGAAAVRWAREARPDIVICDVVMPTLNGVEAAKQIKEFLPQACIILFTGQAAAGELIKKAEEDGHHFPVLAKPLKPDILLVAIGQFLESSVPASARKRA